MSESQAQPHEDFFAAQRRNRRATWRISALCAIAIAAAGVPLTLIVTPLLYAVFMSGAALLDYFSPLSPAFWQWTHDLARIANTAADFLFNHKPADSHLLLLAAILFLGPGVMFAVLLWAGVFAILKRGGVGGTLITMGARTPNRNDERELQLDDVVHEMAVAARMTPLPRVLVIDGDGANAAAIGTSADDVYVVVSRGLIEGLRREEMQGALAHLIASISNGDLHIAFRITSVFETLGLVVTMLNAPFGPHARETVRRIIRFALHRNRTDAGAEAEAIAALLAAGNTPESDDIDRFFNSPNLRGLVHKALNVILFPIFFTNVAIQLTLWFLSGAMLAPAFAMLWRTRKYLADATSVQLTRNPDGLASALVRLNDTSGGVGAGFGTPYLFIVSPGHGGGIAPPRADQMEAAARAWASIDHQDIGDLDLSRENFTKIKAEVTAMRVAAMGGDRDAIERLAKFAAAMAAMRAASAPRVSGTSEHQTVGPLGESLLSFHPSVRRRLARLHRMGARVDLDTKPTSHVVEIILSIVLGPLFALLVVLFVILIAMMIMLNLVLLSLWFAIIHSIFSFAIHH